METRKYLSLGAGVQSSVLALLIDRGEFGEPGVDAPALAVFADTGGEPPDVYDHLAWLESELKRIEVVRVGERDLYDDVTRGFDAYGKRMGSGQIPAYTLSERGGRLEKGIAMRQCTSRYKIRPIERHIRGRWGNPRPNKLHVETWVGISLDEVYRVKDDYRKSWIRRHPLVERNIRRADCEAWFGARYPDRELPRSACFFCPYHSAAEWTRLRDKHPAEFARAIVLDEAIRTQPPIDPGASRFLHERRLPLAEAVDADAKALADKNAQLPLPNRFLAECEGHCGI